MKNKIEKVAVLGAGTMGAQIAGHLVNAGISSCLFDISQELADKGVGILSTLKPAPLYKPKNVSLIEAFSIAIFSLILYSFIIPLPFNFLETIALLIYLLIG